MRKDVIQNTMGRNPSQADRRTNYFSPWSNENWLDHFLDSDVSPFTNDSRFLSPAIDIEETAEEYLVSADLPGINKDDISIDCSANLLTITAERKYESGEGRKENRRERFFGTYQRSFTLPQGADTSKVDATYEGGVLMVHIPKGEAVKSRRIQIGERNKQGKDSSNKH